jgi:hypothetical protein
MTNKVNGLAPRGCHAHTKKSSANLYLRHVTCSFATTQGWQLRLTNEVGGLAPGAAALRYVRQQAHASWAAALTDGLSLHIEAATGVL